MGQRNQGEEAEKNRGKTSAQSIEKRCRGALTRNQKAGDEGRKAFSEKEEI